VFVGRLERDRRIERGRRLLVAFLKTWEKRGGKNLSLPPVAGRRKVSIRWSRRKKNKGKEPAHPAGME